MILLSTILVSSHADSLGHRMEMKVEKGSSDAGG